MGFNSGYKGLKRSSNLFQNISNSSEFKRRALFNEDLYLVTGSVLDCKLMTRHFH